MKAHLRQTRVRLAAAYTLVFTLVAILASIAVWLAFRNAEYSTVDDTLSAQANALISGLDDANGHITFQGSDGLPSETSQGIAISAALVSKDGTVIDRSGQAPAVSDVRAQVRQSEASGQVVSATGTVNGLRQRILVQPVTLGNGSRVSLVVARTVRELDATLTRTAIFLAIVVGMLALSASLAGYWLAGRALRPVRQIAATARNLSEHDLHRRLNLDLPDDELGELADTFNAMLARLEAAFESLRQFTADAAHELRAPLTLVRAELELALNRTRSADEYHGTLESVLVETERLSRMVDQLLLLARADAGALEALVQEVDVSDLLEETVSRWRPLAGEKKVQLLADIPESGTLRGDPDLLRRMLDNLIDNALRHTPAGGSIRISGSHDPKNWSIAVEDTGPGVDESLRASLFDRFTRADPARGRETGGAGLGLSLCAIIARLHGGRITLEDAGPGARFVTLLPA
ncbi:MAG TPA: heavy metal sensor histidine kinase [Candidatus Dormibacteraeota bacterium]|nr:heavy metal sensor histidine kinase [Candidatus Dormibacteraeota bacterium]